MKAIPKEEKMKVIKCSRCDLPNPYGSAHICDEYEYAMKQLSTPKGKRIDKWFNSGMRTA